MTLTVTILTSPEQPIEEITTAFSEFIHNYTDYGCSYKPDLVGVKFAFTNLFTWGDCKQLLATLETILNNRRVRGVIQHVNF